jgi:hypothetical protein
MTPPEHDELLPKCQILEKETVMRAKEANQRSEAESRETKHAGMLSQNSDVDETSYVIDSKVGRSFGEEHSSSSPFFLKELPLFALIRKRFVLAT